MTTTDHATTKELRKSFDREHVYYGGGEVPAVDVPRLRKTFDWVTEQHRLAERGLPSEWDQSSWVSNIDWALWRGFKSFDWDQRQDISVDCGSACCFFGKVVWDAGAVFVTDATVVMPGAKQTQEVADAGTELLGLTPTEAKYLYTGDNDYEDVKKIVKAIMLRTGEKI